MALYSPPLDEIRKAIKSQNGVDLVQNEYIWSNPGTQEPDGNGRNTLTSITSINEASSYDGNVTVSYRRLDLADLIGLVGDELRLGAATTTWQVAQALNTRFGLNFVEADIVSAAVTLSDTEPTPVTITAAANSRGWVGTVTINVIKGLYVLNDVLTTKILPGLYYPNGNERKPFGEAYSYWRNFTARGEDIDEIGQAAGGGTYDKAALAAILTQITTHAWSDTVAQRYSLLGSTFVFAGNTEDGDGKYNEDYERVLVVEVSDSCLGLGGKLILHYNLPDGFD